MSVLFAMDLGNTRAAIGIAGADGLRDVIRVPIARLGELSEGLSLIGAEVDASDAPVAASSVNPAALEEARRLVKQFTSGPLAVAGKDFPIPIAVDVAEPEKTGPDRLLAALAAWRRNGRPCIVLDFGTATTVDAVDGGGRFLGGAIVPGVDLMARSLADGTAALPKVAVEKGASAIGRDTKSAISNGIYFGHLGLVERLVEEFRAALGPEAEVWATGGGLALLSEGLACVDHIEPNLVLEGLVIVYRESTK